MPIKQENKDALHSTGTATQHRVITYEGEEPENARARTHAHTHTHTQHHSGAHSNCQPQG